MKKWILACSLVPCCASVPAWSQSSVTLFGRADVSVQTGNAGGTRITRLDSSNVAPSVWGLLGSEDLGGGYRAIFKLEDGFNPTTGSIAGSGNLFGREAWVGLNGPFGQVQFGVNYTPFFTTLVTFAQGPLSTWGWGNASNNYFFLGTTRNSNSVRYNSPTFAGLTLRASYSNGSNGDPTLPGNLGRTFSAGLAYRLGQFSADVDYLQQSAAKTTPVNAGTTTVQGNYVMAAVMYDFDWIQPAFIFQTHRGGQNVAASSTTTFQNPNNNYYDLSVLIRHIGPGIFMLDFGQYKRLGNSSGDSTSYAIRYDYSLSKRTGVYAGVGHVRNGSTATFTMSGAQGAGLPTKPGASVTSFVLGMITRF
ncbi:Outer membrane protein porin [Paraburkholderia caribensis MBA4]|uniref:Outer membrane protein porin n=1 Tax=Paraburkholderia caribensis MBA4 TaxID=1323664 RepID=A0A0P0RIQ7_9BURK|nr:porin [Paraburkholderia caribensis]ALL68488.1 Outer membrane protein porin [Paraburkholderia caribensis MBA4]